MGDLETKIEKIMNILPSSNKYSTTSPSSAGAASDGGDGEL